ncbi:MAG: 2-oxoglutarate dehydrogenase complex dihydrolipoyllysine-residue succinyltransferase [Rhodobacteraceae bacterium]|nr:2-oxoglutarate dehydrogenase complex dihydrolipoyllysine-residue succinyltransferase [Paracoccaceae bacterium]MBT6271756.1 2-oxoglutarate dehydrogenase complex dihydrolipoyllysine-residue succinyltransferase [Paracoccaceae bacterium]
MIQVRVPTLGESVTEATVATWFKKVGDPIAVDEMMCELETDKVTVEVPAPINGILGKIISGEGTTVAIGALLAEITEGNSNEHTETKNEQDIIKQREEGDSSVFENVSVTKPDIETITNDNLKNAPSAIKLMTENSLSVSDVKGTGRDGRIMKEDVVKVLNNPTTNTTLPDVPSTTQVEGQSSNLEERVKMTRLRKTIAERLKKSQNTSAMLTTYNEVDMTEVMNLRAKYKSSFETKHGVKLGFMSFFIKACCHALFEIPEVNSEIDGDYIIYKKYVNMGVATGTPSGLVVPVINNAESLSFADLEKKISEKANKAREGLLMIEDMQGGSFTISNGGVYGSLMSSPILNPPQSGILGMHKIQDRPVVIDGKIEIRPMMYLALTYDHRVVDGKGAVTFLVRVKDALEDPRRLLIDL